MVVMVTTQPLLTDTDMEVTLMEVTMAAQVATVVNLMADMTNVDMVTVATLM